MSWAILDELSEAGSTHSAGVDMYLPLADVEALLDNHEEHLGLHLRNTKFLAPQVEQHLSSGPVRLDTCPTVWWKADSY